LTKDDLEYLSKHLKKMTSKGCQMIEKGHPNLLQKKQKIFEKLIDIQLLLEDGNWRKFWFFCKNHKFVKFYLMFNESIMV